MDKNNKLDKLLQAARESKPVLSFEEASSMIKGTTAASGAMGSAFAKGIIAVVSIVTLSVAGYFIFSNNDEPITQPETTIAPTVVETPDVVAVQPTQAQASVETAAPKVSTEVKELTPVKETAKAEAENVGVKFTEVKSNTLRTVSINSTQGSFVLKFNGDDLKEMTLNNVVVAEESWASHTDVITQAVETISNKKSTETSSDDGDKNFMNAFKDQLAKDGLITGNVTSLKFNKDGLFINGNEQDKAVHKRYLDFYKAKTGKEIGTTNFSIKGNQN